MFVKRLVVVLLMLLVTFIVTACNALIIDGSGDLVTETRPVSNFDSIELSGSGEVIMTQDGSESLSIETDDNIMEYIKTEVKGGTLKIGFENGLRMISPSQLTFYVSVDDLNRLDVSGSGDIEAGKLETGRLDASVSGSGDVRIGALTATDFTVDISGSAEITMAGDVATQNVEISGSGKYLAGDVCSASVTVDVSGSGDATVCAIETLNADVSGSGSIDYYGRPVANTATSGSGSVNSLGEK